MWGEPGNESSAKTKHSWQNGTRCRDGVNVLLCRSHLVWLVFEGSLSLHGIVLFGKLFCDFITLINIFSLQSTHSITSHNIQEIVKEAE